MALAVHATGQEFLHLSTPQAKSGCLHPNLQRALQGFQRYVTQSMTQIELEVARERAGWKIELKGACVEIYNEANRIKTRLNHVP